MGARRLISGTGSKRLTGARRVEDVGKQTRSEPVETACPGKSRSDSSLNATYMSKVITLRYGLQIWGEKSFSLLTVMRATGYSKQSKTTGWVVHMLRDSSRALALLSISTNTQDLIPNSPLYIQYNSHNCSSENFKFNQTKFLRWYFSFFSKPFWLRAHWYCTETLLIYHSRD